MRVWLGNEEKKKHNIAGDISIILNLLQVNGNFDPVTVSLELHMPIALLIPTSVTLVIHICTFFLRYKIYMFF